MTKSVAAQWDVLVVGGGLAGISAVCRLAESGLKVRLVEQALSLGGSVLRQAVQGSDERLKGVHEPAWRTLMARLRCLRDRVDISLGVAFSGFDSTGSVVVVHTQAATHERLDPKAVILATGATERVRPRLGWESPGVMTVGALQIMMKTSLRAPQKRVLVAGSGPLLLAVGAQLTRMGQPPVAVVEAAHPFRHLIKSAQLPWRYWQEGAGYLATLLKAGVPIYQGHEVTRIGMTDESGLQVTLERQGKNFHLATDYVALHDGIQPNNYGMRPDGQPLWHVAGDCSLALGARAAAMHGELVALDIIQQLSAHGAHSSQIKAQEDGLRQAIKKEEKAQKLLREIYQVDEAPALNALSPDTVICRCEHKTLRDLRALGPDATNREIRLLGRFAMGACQGRFCSEWLNVIRGKTQTPEGLQLMGKHWPAKPISIQALVQEASENKPTV